MKKSITLFISLLSLAVFSQEKLNTLSLPNTPATAILGMQPSVILKPKSYRALEAALYSNFTNSSGNGIIPNDFGLEFTPYWATTHGLSLEEYLYPKLDFQQIVRNSSFSIATTQKFLLQDSTATKSIALGYRTSVFFGNKNDKVKVEDYVKNLSQNQRIGSKIIATLEEYKEKQNFPTKEEYALAIKDLLALRIQSELKSKSNKEIATLMDNIYSEIGSLPFDKENMDSFELAFSNLIEEKIGSSYEEFKSYITNRQGFLIDFATAIHINFPDNNSNFSEVPKYSLWLSPSYNFSNQLQFLKATATLHYEHFYLDYFKKYFPDSKVFENNFDYGASISGSFKKFSIEFEAAGRNSRTLIKAGQDPQGNLLYRKESSNDTQYIGTFSYRLTEQIALSYQIGSGFKPVFNINGGNLISLLSLNLGFGGPDKGDVTVKSLK
jgi:hypothetical protein